MGTAGAASAAPLLGTRGSAETADWDGMLNLIVIVVDTLGTHWLGCYGNQEIRTPSVDGLARKSLLFQDAYPEALPTIPDRRSIYTGRRIFPSDYVLQNYDTTKIRGWHQLYVEDVTLSETLRGAGYTTCLIGDVFFLFFPDRNFARGFNSWRAIRGQHIDPYETGPRKGINPRDFAHPTQWGPSGITEWMMPYLINRQFRQSDDDYPTSQVFQEAARWLENNIEDNQPFYMHLESFSPHEFWDPPEDYYRLYMKSDYKGPRLIYPPTTTARMTPLEVEHVRALYAGYVTFVDSRIGRFLNKVDELGLMENTVILFTADHGTMMGEQGQFHKGEGRGRTQVTHVPLMVYHPQQPWAGRRVFGFVQHTDVMPTLLDILGVEIPSRVTGESLKPLMESGGSSRRQMIVTGWNDHATIRTQEWLYQGRWNPGQAFEELYDVRRDPLELENVNFRYPDLVKDFRAQLKDYVDSGWEITRGTFATVLPG